MERTLSELPPEILIKIFEQLESPEIFKVSEVCKYWCHIAQHATIVNKTIVKLCTLHKTCFLKSWRKFQFKLNIDPVLNSEQVPAKFFEFKEKFGENIIELQFAYVYLPSLDILQHFLQDLKNLREIRFDNCRFKDDKMYPTEQLALNVTSITFDSCCSGMLVDYVLLLAPNLKMLNTCSGYEENIVRHLLNPKLTKSLRDLRLNQKVARYSYAILSTTHLRLETFHWESYGYEVPVDDFEAFLTRQAILKKLILVLAKPFISQLIRICSVIAIEHLSFHCYSTERDIAMDIANFEIFWKLKHLTLKSASSALFNSLLKTSEIQSLTLPSFFNDIDDDIIDKFKYLKNLRVLNISFESNGYDDEYQLSYIENKLLQGVFKHLLNLRELYLEDISYCYMENCEITDFGITGFPGGFGMSRLENLEIFVLKVNTDGITDVSVRYIENLKSLKLVKINKSKNAKSSNNEAFHKDKDMYI